MTLITFQDNGRILAIERAPEQCFYELNLEGNKIIVPDDVKASFSKNYVFRDLVMLRPTQQTTLSNTHVIANGVDSGVLQDLPIPCTVFIENTSYEVTDGLLEFTLNLPGIYQIRVTNCFPYLDKEFTCEGIAPV